MLLLGSGWVRVGISVGVALIVMVSRADGIGGGKGGRSMVER